MRKQSHLNPSASRQRRVGGSTIWLIAWLCLAAGFVSWALLGHDAATASTARVAPLLQAKPIEKIQLGERVRASAPTSIDAPAAGLSDDPGDLDHVPAQTRAVSFELTKPDGSKLHIDLIRPLFWVEALGLTPGATIELEMPEMGAVGQATCVAVKPCPEIRPGSGSVVTGLFRHTASDIVELRFDSGSGPGKDPIITTSGHPFFSLDRGDFIAAGQLRSGERLAGSDGRPVVVESVSARGPPQEVFNLEITGEHTYFVGSPTAGAAPEFVWVHNACKYTVYQSVVGGKVEYVGITRASRYGARYDEHAEIGRFIKPINGMENVSYRVARVLEDRLIRANYGRRYGKKLPDGSREKNPDKFRGILSNFQGGIDPAKLSLPKYRRAIKDAKELLAANGLNYD